MRVGASALLGAAIVLASTELAAAGPIEIDTIQQLDSIGIDPSMPLSGSYILGSNISALGFDFTPIGTLSNPFTGSFQGNNFTISNLSIGPSADNVTTSCGLQFCSFSNTIGLFGRIGAPGSVSNLSLSNASMDAASVGGSFVGPGTVYVGGIAGYNQGAISSVTVSGTINGSGGSNTGVLSGGIVGENAGSITSSSFTTGTVRGSLTNYMNVGGLTGVNSGNITSSTASGLVTTNGGGNNSAQYTVGGLAGTNSGTILKSSATADVAPVNTNGDQGGIAGVSSGHISQSFATGSVSGPGINGGLVGWDLSGGYISDSYATGPVRGTSANGGRIGGLVGLLDGGNISQSYSAGEVSAPSPETIGGLVSFLGNSGGTVTSSYWDTQASGQTGSSGGTPATTNYLTSGAMPAGFDPNVWKATTGQYPTLINNPQNPPPLAASPPATATEALQRQLHFWRTAINTEPVIDLRTVHWDGALNTLGEIDANIATSISDIFANLTSRQSSDYGTLIDAAYSFNNAAKNAIQTALTDYQSGDTVGAQQWLALAQQEANRQSEAQKVAVQLVQGQLGVTYDFVNAVYKTSELAFHSTCAFTGPAALLCNAIGDQLFIATDTFISSQQTGLAGAAQTAISEEVANFIVGRLPIGDLATGGSSTLGTDIATLVNSPGFDHELQNDLINEGFKSFASTIETTAISNNIPNVFGSFNYSTAAQENTQNDGIANTGSVNLDGQTVQMKGNQLVNMGTMSGYGSLVTNGLQNYGTVSLNNEPSQISGSVVNASKLTVTNSKVSFTDPFTNTGSMDVSNSVVQFFGHVSNDGSFLADPSMLYFQDLFIGTGGYLTGGAGDLFSVAGDFDNESTRALQWNTRDATLAFTGAGCHVFELVGKDIGPSSAGYSNNFSWGVLDLGRLTGALCFGEGNPNFNDALYVQTLLGARITGGMITNIDGDGYNLYYDAGNPLNAYLSGGRYSLSGSGYLVPVETSPVPEPESFWLFLCSIASLVMVHRVRRADDPATLNTVENRL